jgi:hypothetical protein
MNWELFDAAAKPDLPPIRGPHEFPPSIAPALREALKTIDTQPQTIAAADRAQGQLIDLFVAHDHLAAAFLEVYHGITVAVIDALERGVLTPKPFFVRLAGKFAERHFDGVKAALGIGPETDAHRFGLWAPSFALDNQANTPAMANFTVGMCCHINFDLAISLDETIRELGYERDDAALADIERGHNYVDTILAEKVKNSCELLAGKFRCQMSKAIIDKGATQTVGEVSMSMIRRWRAKTFTYALQLCRAASEQERAAIRMDIYRAGARKTVRLFQTLPSLIEGTLAGTWLSA